MDEINELPIIPHTDKFEKSEIEKKIKDESNNNKKFVIICSLIAIIVLIILITI